MKIFRYLRPYWLFALLSPLCMAAEVIIDLWQPKLLSRIVDQGVLGSDMRLVVSTGLLMLGLVAIGGMAGIASTAFACKASQNFGNDLRVDAYKRVMSMSIQSTDKFTTGSLITRMTNDITSVEGLVSMALRMFVRATFMFLGGIVMALTLDINFGFVILAALPVEIIVMLIVLKKAFPIFGEVQTRLDKVNSVVQENVTGARMVKAYVREGFEKKRFGRANDEFADVNLRVAMMFARVIPVVMIVMNFSVVAIILIGGYRVEAGSLKVGSVMAGVTYITQILSSLLMVGMMFQALSRAVASINRINEVLDTHPVVKGGPDMPAAGGELEFEHVFFSYPQAHGEPVLSDISFKVENGETLAILGATGSGKTSLVNLIPRFYDPTSGKIYLNGADISTLDLDLLRRKIGFVLQKSELFSGSVADNIRWGNPDASDEEVRRAARIAQADDFVSEMPEGYDTVIGEKGSSLSGGQKQRLSIARALLKKPDILIFDDSTSALDLGTEARLKKAIAENSAGTTTILIAQRVASVKNADRILLLDNGKIESIGTHDELMERSRLYREIYYSQQHDGKEAV